MDKASGMTYAPEGRPAPVVAPGDFRFAAIGLDHGHIYGMCNGLLEAGAELVWVYDPDPTKLAEFCRRYPAVRPAASESAILEDEEVTLVASAAVPADRASLGVRVMDHSKDYFVDKPPLTTLEQLHAVKAKAAQSGQKYMVYYSERLHVESAVFAGQLIEEGVIGRVLQVVGLGPHRLDVNGRPDWFFQRERYGGILCDIGSHQIEQFLYFSGARDATVLHSKVANYHHPDLPELEDFGDATLLADNGATGYLRVDWFTPDGLDVWGDGRTFILGSEGTIELRKYIDIGRDAGGDHVYLVNQTGAYHIPVAGKVGYPFFGRLIVDCLNRTELAMTQTHAFKAAELAVKAQMQAVKIAAGDAEAARG